MVVRLVDEHDAAVTLRALHCAAQDALEAAGIRIRLDARPRAVERDVLAEPDDGGKLGTLLEQPLVALRLEAFHIFSVLSGTSSPPNRQFGFEIEGVTSMWNSFA
jgi:hypothetical protein